MKKILYIDPQSGDNLAMYDYELLSRINNDITYICSKTYNYKELDSINQIPIFSYTKYRSNLLKGISYLASLCKLCKIISKEKPEVIHIQWFRIPKIEYKLYNYLKKKYNFKLIHTVHNILPHVNGDQKHNQYLNLYNLCDGLIVHTQTTAINLSKLFLIKERKITIAPHGPLHYNFSNDEIQNEISKIKDEYNINAKYVISMLGYQSLYKGTDLAIEAWRTSTFLVNNNQFCFVIAGKNKDYKTDKTSEDKNMIIINDRLSDLQFAALMKMSNLILLPYRKIDQSGVLLTIIDEGIPYCSTKVGELTKPFEFGDIGWTISNINSEELKTLLENICENPHTLVEKQNNYKVWNQIRDYYSWDKAAEATNKLYNS